MGHGGTRTLAQWAVPSPVSDAEINWAKERLMQARMDQRTRERLPVLPVLARTAADRRTATPRHLLAANDDTAREIIEGTGGRSKGCRAQGQRAARVGRGHHYRQAPQPVLREGRSILAFAVIEVLRLTGIRCEELLELTHHGITEYRLPTTC